MGSQNTGTKEAVRKPEFHLWGYETRVPETLASGIVSAGGEAPGNTVQEIIPNLNRCHHKPRGKLTYHVTQVVTSNGNFGSSVNHMGKVEGAKCMCCTSGKGDTVEETHYNMRHGLITKSFNGSTPGNRSTADENTTHRECMHREV